MTKKALGKGLSSLIPDTYVNKSVVSEVSANSANQEESGFLLIPIDLVETNAEQPRKDFNPEAIEELAASIKEKGILQPIVVTKAERGQYSLICGERRLRAARLVGLTEIPAVIKDVAKEEFLEWALIENIQRQDLNPLEEADAYQRLIQERRISQETLADRLGKNRTTVTNTLRLLRLPEDLRVHVASGRLTAGHARALLSMLTPEHQRQLAKRIIDEGLSVRQVEAIVNRSNAHRRKAKTARNLSAEIVDLENRLAQHLGTQVKIYPRKNKNQGRLEIHYFSLDDLDRILETLRLKES